jgi:hypothetical protein
VATQTEKRVVYAAGVVQGIALVTFPAAAVGAVIAAAMGVWSLVVAGRRPSPTTLHPQPGQA